MIRIKFITTAVVTVLLFITVLPLSAQNLLRMPESVVYDSSHSRYLASNYTTGHIVYLDRQGNQDYFVVNQDCRNGLHIEGNNVWAACIEQGIKGFDLDSAQLVMHVVIDSAINCNDITSDTSGNLYVSDVYANKIYKVSLDDYSYSVFVDNGIDLPNGIYFQKRYNRILLVSLIYNSPIQAIDVADSTVTELVYTNRHNLDGITEDNQGNIYFSSWSTTSIYMYDSTLTNPPQFVYFNAGGPADIFYDKVNNVLAAPVMNINAVVFIDTPISGTGDYAGLLPKLMEIRSIYPNPFNPGANIELDLGQSSSITLKVYDITGKEVTVLAQGFFPAGRHTLLFDGSQYSSGVYLVRLESNGYSASRKMILLK